jgi:hypothetical protein
MPKGALTPKRRRDALLDSTNKRKRLDPSQLVKKDRSVVSEEVAKAAKASRLHGRLSQARSTESLEVGRARGSQQSRQLVKPDLSAIPPSEGRHSRNVQDRRPGPMMRRALQYGQGKKRYSHILKDLKA